MERLFPDRKNDGNFQNPSHDSGDDEEDLFDFYKVMKSDDPMAVLAETIAYYPKSVTEAASTIVASSEELQTAQEEQQEEQQDVDVDVDVVVVDNDDDTKPDFFIFVPGLGQIAQEASKRSRRYADTLQVGIVNLHNGSFLKDNAIFEFLNPYMDWIDAGLDRIGISGSPVIDHTAELILFGATKQTKMNFASDSHGTIFMARAVRRAKHRFLMTHQFDEELWEERTSQYINIVTFGNGHRRWPKGPNYVMVYIQGDPLPERLGLTVEKAKDRSDVSFLSFDKMFDDGSFEAHNMMFTIELLRTTFEKNGIDVGKTPALLDRLQSGTCDIAKPNEVQWPTDLSEYAWDPASLDAIGQGSTTTRGGGGSMNTSRPVIVGPSDEYLAPVLWSLFLVFGAVLFQKKILKK